MGDEVAQPAATAPATASQWVPRQLRSRRRRVLLPDGDLDTKHLRVTWHPERQLFVVSTWNSDVCTGTIKIPVQQAPELMRLLVDGMSDAINVPHAAPAGPAPKTVTVRVREKLHSWFGRRTRPAKARDQATSATVHRFPKPPTV